MISFKHGRRDGNNSEYVVFDALIIKSKKHNKLLVGARKNYSYMNMCRGDVPAAELVKSLSWWEKPIGSLMIGKLEGKYDLKEGYNLEAAKIIKPVLGDTPLFLVGGMRTVSFMEEVLDKKFADFISMSRPFIREPFLVNKIKEGHMDKVSCVSCNRCLAAVPNELPVYCYNKGLPVRPR